MFKFCFVLLFIGLSVNGVELPSDIEPCHYEDTKCFKTVFQMVIKKYAKTGYPELGLVQLDPLSLEDIINERDDSKPVSVALKATGIKFYGLSNLVVTKITGFTKEFDGHLFDVTVRIPEINIIANYTLDAKVLVLPIHGEGKSNTTLFKNTINVKYIAKIEKRNDGEEYIRIENLKTKYSTKKLHIQLDNLFNKVLGEATNKFLNDNWEIVYNEVNSGFYQKVDKQVKDILQRVLYTIPHKKLFKQ